MALTDSELYERILSFKEAGIPLLLSNTTYFKSKIDFLEKGSFLMGIDTFKRIFNSKIGNDDSEILDLCKKMDLQSNRFVVAGRVNNDGQFESSGEYRNDMPPGFHHLLVELPDFRRDISSTQIREMNSN